MSFNVVILFIMPNIYKSEIFIKAYRDSFLIKFSINIPYLNKFKNLPWIYLIYL